MATKLKNLEVKKVDFVDAGANPDAHIKLFKRNSAGENNEGGSAEKDNEKTSGVFKKLLAFIGKAAKMSQEEIDSAMEEIQKGDSVSFGEKYKEAKNRKISDEIWDICWALQSSLCSILNDEDLDSTAKETAMQESLTEFSSELQGCITQWSGGKECGIVMKNEEVTETEAEVAKSAVEKLSAIIEKASEPKEKDQKETKNENPKGDEEEMKIDKSKMTPAERAFFEDLEKRYGTEDGAQVETPAQATEVTEPPVTKSVTPPAQAEQNQASAEPDGADIYKGLHPAVKAEMEALKKFKEEAEERELGEVAKKYEIIGKKKEELVPLFKSLRAAGGTAYNDMIAVLDGAVATVEKSGAFSEIGKSGHGAGATSSAETKIAGIAKKYQEQDATLSYEAAVAKAWENNPDLMDEYEEEAGF